MPKVRNKYGRIEAECNSELYVDFLFEVEVAGEDLVEVLSGYREDLRKQLSNYIIARLAEIDSDYVEIATSLDVEG